MNENKIDQKNLEAELEKIAKGKLKLYAPMKAAGEELSELDYDFRALTGWEYADALDSDNAAGSIFKLTNKQAIALFAAAAAKATKGKNGEHPLDAQDIRERLGIDDAIRAAQIATVFFIGSARAGSKRSLNE